MDQYVIDYLKSGKAWVLVGSGPSIEMGYPSWQKMASIAIDAVKSDIRGASLKVLESAMAHEDFPTVFEEAKKLLGGARLLQILQDQMKPSGDGRIYDLLARWPVPVYMTTNYDNEIQNHLATLGESYVAYSNSEDHFAFMSGEPNGSIFKLHGDLRSETGLILTANQYREIDDGDNSRYWRNRMLSVFQMNRVIVVGHSLTDTNIKHVLEAAKRGAGVIQPVCWIAPDVSVEKSREYLEKYRIRVISYDNRDKKHTNLLRLIQAITNFVPARTAVKIKQQIAKISESPLQSNAAAPGFFVFTKLSVLNDFEKKRIEVLAAAIQSAIPKLETMGDFTLQSAIEMAGWPKNVLLANDLGEELRKYLIDTKLLLPIGDKLRVGKTATSDTSTNKRAFEHMQQRFRDSLRLRLSREFQMLQDADINTIVADIEASLTGYFREGGLSLATTLFAGSQIVKQPVPGSIIQFINEAATRYNDQLCRLAFSKVSVDAFVNSETAEREYLGRIAQGFFAFHCLGVFGDAAAERLNQAKSTVWLVDSNIQIPALAYAAATNAVFRDCFSKLKDRGIRFFTTEKLFEETVRHLRFAENTVRENGAFSPLLVAAASGQAPFRKSNQFLEGFIRWQAAGNPCDWEMYLNLALGNHNPTSQDFRTALQSLGVEVVDFASWPGFVKDEYAERDDIAERIKSLRESPTTLSEDDLDRFVDPYKKEQPEAEAFLIVRNERTGKYYILSEKEVRSPSWFISSTSILNIIEHGPVITWQPDAFLKFTSTVSPIADQKSAERAFETLLWEIAESGLSLIDAKMVSSVFGGVIDGATIDVSDMHRMWEDTLSKKYGEAPESVLKRVALSDRPIARIQLLNEIAATAHRQMKESSERVERAEHRAENAERKARQAEMELEKLKGFRAKQLAKQQNARIASRKRQSKKKKK